MNKIRLSAIVVDDEIFAVSNLCNLLTNYCHFINVIGTASNGTEAITKINNLKPDIVFLDVNMPKQSGFDILELLNQLPLVVFVTAHEQYALKAMKVCAVDFLLKPIDINELIQTETKLLQLHSIKSKLREDYRIVLRNLTGMLDKPESVRKITLANTNGYDIIEIDNIIYLSGDDNYTTFYFTNRKSILIAKTLKEYEEMLAHFGFMRIHKSTLLNLAHVKKLVRGDTLSALMSNEEILHISRRKMPEVLDWAKTQAKI